MEGTNAEKFTSPEKTITYRDYQERLKKDETVFSHQVMFYGKSSTTSLTLSDTIELSAAESEQAHHFNIKTQLAGEIFGSRDVDYLGNVLYKDARNVSGRRFVSGDIFEFSLSIEIPNQGVVLRRESESIVGKWNEKAEIKINGHDLGVWFIPMGVLSPSHTLQQNDFTISKNFTNSNKDLRIEIRALSMWRDISYSSYVIT